MATEILAGLIVLILGMLVDVIMQLKKQMAKHDESLSILHLQITDQMKYVGKLPCAIQEEKLQSLTEVVHIMQHDTEQTGRLLNELSQQIRSIESSINTITMSINMLEDNIKKIKDQLTMLDGENNGRT